MPNEGAATDCAGPCRIKEKPQSPNDTYVNPYAWNDKVSYEAGKWWGCADHQANVFFLDQPIGVGFSHAEHGQLASTTEIASLDVAAFIDIVSTMKCFGSHQES